MKLELCGWGIRGGRYFVGVERAYRPGENCPILRGGKMIYLKDKNLHAALKEERIFFTRINNTLIRKYGKENLKRYHDNRMNGMSVEEAERDADRTFPPKHKKVA
jgi:hypothetical protein